MRRKLLSILICIFLLFPALTLRAGAASHAYTADEVEDFCGGIAAYKASACGASSVQEWIDTGLCDAAGTVAEFYAITLSQSGNYDFSRYERALLAYLDSHEVSSPTTREKYALALLACGSTDGYIQRVCNSDIGAQGMLMSLVFGLHLLNNGCTSSLYTTDGLIGEILSRQLTDGGWAVIGTVGDPDVTAMTVQSLAPYYGSRSDVNAAVDSALSLLVTLQLDSGGYRSMGKENCESAAQVLTALSSLGIDQNTDPRFIKNGHTVLEAMLGYRNADGSFAHAGSGFNESATMQAFYAMRAYLRMQYGQSPLYILDHRPAADPGSSENPADQPGEVTPSAPTEAQSISPTATEATSPDPTAEPASASAPTGPENTYPTEPPHGDYHAPTGDAVFQPDGSLSPSDTAAITATPDDQPAKGGYKLYAIIGVLTAAGIACGILLLKKKRNIKHYLAVAILAGIGIAFILLTNFESKETYARVEEKTNPTGTVTMTISCSVLNGEEDKPLSIPDDGIILPETTFTIDSDMTVYDVLLEASKRYDIRIDNRGGEGSAYIAGIQYLYEFDYGSLSGWMYRVNGEFPDVGCQGYRLKDGDCIEWLFTKEIGKDL